VRVVIMLDPYTISQVYTLAEIDAEITALKAIYDTALKNKSYSLDDMHSKQRVEQHDIKEIRYAIKRMVKSKGNYNRRFTNSIIHN